MTGDEHGAQSSTPKRSAIRWFFSQKVWPRCRGLVDWTLAWSFVALVAVLLAELATGNWLTQGLDASEIAGALLTFASIGAGFALTGVVVAVTSIERDAVSAIGKAAERKGQPAEAPVDDLTFVFVWSALAHLALVVWSGVVLVVAGLDVASPPNTGVRSLLAAITAGVATYALARFVVVLLTLHQLGDVLVKFALGRYDNVACPQDGGTSTEE